MRMNLTRTILCAALLFLHASFGTGHSLTSLSNVSVDAGATCSDARTSAFARLFTLPKAVIVTATLGSRKS